MSKTVRIITGAILIVAGLVIAPQLAIIGAQILLSGLTMPGLPRRQAATTTLQLGEQPRQAVFGRAMVGGSLLDAVNHGGKYGTDWEVMALALADHRCDALEGFYAGDKYVAFTGNGEVPGYRGKLIVRFYAGTADQTADPTLMSKAGWAATDTLAGVCYVVVEYKADANGEKNPVWPSGRPTFGWVLRGKRCYDPRKDSTVAGGSGPHRWSTPATWEWSENLAVCRYNWVRGVYACDRVDQPDQLLVGRGLTPSEAPLERVAAAANLADEDVPQRGGGTRKRYTVGAVIGADEVFGDVEDKFAAACAGVVIQPEGSIEVEPGHAKAPVAAITDLDLVVGKPVTFSEFRSEADAQWCNTVVPRYVEPSQKWSDHAAPIRRVTADLITDGGPREATPDLGYVTVGSQAQRIGEVTRRLGRLWRTATVTLGPRFAELEEGDWIVWTSARRTGGQPVTFRIEGYQINASWQITLQLREIAASVFSWSADDEIAEGAVAVQQPKPDDAAFAGDVTRAAHQMVAQTVAYPASTTATSISIVPFRATLDDGRIIDLPAGQIDGLDDASTYRLFYALEDAQPAFTGGEGQSFTDPDGQAFAGIIPAGSYYAAPADSLLDPANPAFVVIRLATTANADGVTYPPAETPPAGDSGTGYGGGGRYQQNQVELQ